MSANSTKNETKRTSKVVLTVCGFFLLTTLTACSSGSTSWQHPTKPKDTWSKDIAACKDRASTLIAREMDIDSDSSFRTRNDLQVQFAAHDARKKRYSYFSNCLVGKGFRQVSGK